MKQDTRYKFEHWVWRVFKINLHRLRHDRRVLERVIIPKMKSLLHKKYSTVLSVGTEWHCLHYRNLFAESRYEFWTIDSDESKRPASYKQHLTAPMREIDTRFPYKYFDLVLFIGWGIDTEADVYVSFAALFRTMATEGLLVVGINEDGESLQFSPLNRIVEAGFVQVSIGCLGYYVNTNTPYRHTYYFFKKPASRL